MPIELPLENHPFAPYAPPAIRYLLIGTFPGRALTQQRADALTPDDWYYGTHTHSLWKLLEQVYGLELPTVAAKKELLVRLGMGVTDVVAAARRRKPTNDDRDLDVTSFQTAALADILKTRALEKLYFTSKQAQKWFAGLEKELRETHGVPAPCFTTPHVVLPSPSPQYVRFGHNTAAGRQAQYQQALPQLP